MTSIEDLLKPVSPEKPCGDDPEYDSDFLQLDVMILGKQEGMHSKEEDKAEEPNWGQIEELCLGLFEKSKHLHVAVVLSLAWLKLRGLAGFRDGTALIRALLEYYWEPIYPLLDPEDQNDPTQRLNILSSLCTPPGATLGDVMQFIARLRQAPLCQSRKYQISAADIIKAETNAPGALSLTDIKNGFASASPGDLLATHETIDEILVNVKEIDASLTRVTDSSSRRSWNELIAAIEDIKRRLNRYAPSSSGQAESDNSGTTTMGNTHEEIDGGATQSIGGAVRSRQDVIKTLDLICDYYQRAEPSSPIPILLRRAQRLVEKDFFEIVRDLNPDSLSHLKTILGKSGEDSD